MRKSFAKFKIRSVKSSFTKWEFQKNFLPCLHTYTPWLSYNKLLWNKNLNYEVIWKIKGLENDKAEKYNPNHSTSTSINPDEFQTVWKNFVISAAAAAKPAMKLKEFLEFLWNPTQFYDWDYTPLRKLQMYVRTY